MRSSQQAAEIPVQSSLREGIWPAGNFDAVTIWSGLEYTTRPAELLTLAAHYCRVDGVLAVQAMSSAVTRKWKTSERGKTTEPHPTRLFTPAALQYYLTRFGFRTERLLPIDHTPYLALLARYVP